MNKRVESSIYVRLLRGRASRTEVAFDTFAEASKHLSAYIGKPVAASWEALNQAAEEWNDDNPDADRPVNVKRFEIISNDEL